MEELRLNDAQKNAIEKQGSNILVSAAAGSGKTYNLAKEYIKILLQSENRDAYRRVLAVTFTNERDGLFHIWACAVSSRQRV